MRLRRMAVVVLLVALGALVVGQTGCSPVQGQLGSSQGDERTVSVSGTGAVSAEPDRVVVRLGVETRADAANEALSQNSEQMQAVVDALTEAGIPAEDIQTQAVRLEPEYESPEREPGQVQQRQLVGYLASNIVEASSDDLGGIGTLLDTAVQAGANRVEGIRFEVSNPSEVLTQAREIAWQDAEQKAQQLADLAGAELGDVLSINESTRGPRPVYLRGAVEQEAAAPVEPGTESIEVDLQVTWALQ